MANKKITIKQKPKIDNPPPPPIPTPLARISRYITRPLMRHGLVLLFTAGVFLLFVIETALPLWLALTGFLTICAATLIYTGPSAAINPKSWRAERRYAMRRDAADLLPYPTLLLNINGTIRLTNRAALKLFERNDLNGSHISSILRNPDILNALSKAQIDGQNRMVEWHVPVPIKRYFHVYIRAALKPRRGMKPFMLISFDEQTEIRQAYQVRSDFITNASHELKTPLTILTGYLETIQKLKPEDEKTRNKFLTIMQEQSTRMVQLIEDLLSLSRIEHQAHKIPSQQTSLHTILHEAVVANETLAQRQKMKINLQLNTEKPNQQNIKVTGSQKELVLMFNNLIYNALTHGYSKEHPHINIHIEPDQLDEQPAWAVSIRDFGAGIAAHHIPRLTERFYRINPEESRKLGGTGLGLAIVKHILTRHRGDMKIQSQPQKGATFTITLPASA